MFLKVAKSRFVALLIATLALAFISPSSASAIGFLVSANPSIGQQLKTAPHTVTLEFSVPSIPASFSGNVIRVTNPSGKPVEVGSAKTSGMTLSVSLQDNLQPDVYQVAFRYVCDDGHILVSAYNFTILNTGEAGTVPAPSSRPSVKPNPSSSQLTAKPVVSAKPSTGPSLTAEPSLAPSAPISATPEPTATNPSGEPTSEPEAVATEPSSSVGIWVGVALLMAALFAGAVIFARTRKK